MQRMAKNLRAYFFTVKQFSNDTGMEFGLDKRANATIIKDKLTSINVVELDIDTTICELIKTKLTNT